MRAATRSPIATNNTFCGSATTATSSATTRECGPRATRTPGWPGANRPPLRRLRAPIVRRCWEARHPGAGLPRWPERPWRRTRSRWAFGTPVPHRTGPLRSRCRPTIPTPRTPAASIVHRTTDDGRTWTIISPDLTTNDTSKFDPLPGLGPDGQDVYSVLFAIAESPVTAGVIWTGSNDGQVQLTRDAGKNWSNVTANIPSLPPAGTVSSIEPSKYAEGTTYVTVDRHRANDSAPYIFKTTDFGKTWKAVRRDPEERLQLRARDSRGSEAPGPALCGHGERALRLVRRWRVVAADAQQPAARSDQLDGRAGRLQRPRDLDVRPGLLDLRRSHAAAAADDEGAAVEELPVRAEAGVHLPRWRSARRQQHGRRVRSVG